MPDMQKVSRQRQTIVCFDGLCLFCSAMVRFVHDRDERDIILFAALQAEPGKKLLSGFPEAPKGAGALLVVEGDRLYTRSDAALQVARRLNGYWPLLYFFKIIPALIRDFLYDQFARRRYGWFGKSDVCFLPVGSLRENFLS